MFRMTADVALVGLIVALLEFPYLGLPRARSPVDLANAYVVLIDGLE
jgi:hypothetical protein